MMDDHYFLTSPERIVYVECKKHGTKTPFKLGHRYFCPDCVGDHLEKAIGQVKLK